jgi:hypothetical protein
MNEPPDFLARFLEGHDAPCPVCGYNLRGVALPRCPECDAPITLTVGSDHARPGPWLLAMLGFGMAIGFDSVVALLLTVPVVATGAESSAVMLFAFMITLAALSAVGLRWVLLGRRVFQSRPRRDQWVRAWLCFAGVFFFHLAAGLTLGLVMAF